MWSPFSFFKKAAPTITDAVLPAKPTEFIFAEIVNGIPKQAYQFVFDMVNEFKSIPAFCYQSLLEKCGLQLAQNISCTPILNENFFSNPCSASSGDDFRVDYYEELYKCAEIPFNQTTFDCLKQAIYCCMPEEEHVHSNYTTMIVLGSCITLFYCITLLIAHKVMENDNNIPALNNDDLPTEQHLPKRTLYR